jgi:hypothetical protein
VDDIRPRSKCRNSPVIPAVKSTGASTASTALKNKAAWIKTAKHPRWNRLYTVAGVAGLVAGC